MIRTPLFLTAVTLSLLVQVVCGSAICSAQESMPIYACVSIPGGAYSSVARYQELAEAGFTTSLSGFDSVNQALAALDSAQVAGVTIWVLCPELETDPATAIPRLKTHPALAGYHITDEPSAVQFPALATRVRTIQALDPLHPCYINLLPIYASNSLLGTTGVNAYRDYVTDFATTVPVPILSFDHYPTSMGFLDEGVYTNLEIVTAVGRSVGKPFWGFYQATRQGTATTIQPPRTLAEFRLECFNNLVYGAQCIQAYTYWETFGDDREAPVDRNGVRTATYDLVKTVNHEVAALSRVFVGAHDFEVRHAGQTSPAGTTAFTPHGAVTGLTFPSGSSLRSAVVSYFTNGGADYVAIVNKDIDHSLAVNLGFLNAGNLTEIRKDGADRAVTGTNFEIEAGDILIFKSVAAPVNLPPTVALQSATSGTAGVPLTMSATASDSDGTVVKVEFFVGTVLIETDTMAPYTATWTVPGLGVGYQVTAKATDNSGASTVSPATTINILAPAVLPLNWSARDIGVVATGGSATYDQGIWSVSGSGADIWGTADGFQFASRPVSGDLMITARVLDLANATNPWAKAGVMIRESLDTGSRHASTFMTPGNGLSYQRRTVTGQASAHTAGPMGTAPYWVRLERIGNVIISSTSPDGTTWRQVRRQTITLSALVQVGLAVTNHQDGQLATARFSDVQIVSSSISTN